VSGQRELHDFFFKEAKRKGYHSRAAYKLIEIDDKRGILGNKDFVLDLGAAPGSWLQVVSQRVGPRGRVIGVDLKEINGLLPDNVTTIQEDVTTLTPERFDGDLFDVILSDMAPNTTGTRIIDHHGSVRLCHSALDLATSLLNLKERRIQNCSNAVPTCSNLQRDASQKRRVQSRPKCLLFALIETRMCNQ